MQADGQSAEAGHLQSELFEQLGEQQRFVAARAEDRDPEPTDETMAARAEAFIEEPLATAAALVEDVEGTGARGWRGDHGLPATSAERALPASVAAVRAGPDALVLVAAELANA